VTLEDDQGKTKLTVKQAGLPAGVVSQQAAAGWTESFDKLAESLK
jgi:hypothetical protein